MTQFDIIKNRVKELEAERNALELELLKREETQISTQIAAFVLGMVLIVSNGMWFCTWAWV